MTITKATILIRVRSARTTNQGTNLSNCCLRTNSTGLSYFHHRDCIRITMIEETREANVGEGYGDKPAYSIVDRSYPLVIILLSFQIKPDSFRGNSNNEEKTFLNICVQETACFHMGESCQCVDLCTLWIRGWNVLKSYEVPILTARYFRPIYLVCDGL